MVTLLRMFSCIYAYIRFSSEAQSDGHSLARQREAVLKRLEAMGLSGVPIVWLEDTGLSAFAGAHLKYGKMGELLAQVRGGKMPRDCLFVCESVSRASRQGAFSLIGILNTLMDAGFGVLFLDRAETFFKENPPQFLALELSLLAELAQQESAQKSFYAKTNWNKSPPCQYDLRHLPPE